MEEMAYYDKYLTHAVRCSEQAAHKKGSFGSYRSYNSFISKSALRVNLKLMGNKLLKVCALSLSLSVNKAKMKPVF